MEDPNSPEMAIKRAQQDDPIVMYLIVRESLGMGVGKTAAQCGHAVGILHIKYNEQEYKFCKEHEDCISEPIPPNNLKIWYEWQCSSFRKVVLKCDDKNWKKIKNEFNNKNMIVVIDNGLTEIPSGSETVIGLWPMYKSDCPKIIKRLQVLK